MDMGVMFRTQITPVFSVILKKVACERIAMQVSRVAF